MSIADQFAPPTMHLNTPDPVCDLNYLPNVGKHMPIARIMSNSFGFGGHNAVLIIGKYVNGHDHD
jgi:3-oxoacyl-[acyl-carrier-protein] synthase II